jgi:hypothetical protein
MRISTIADIIARDTLAECPAAKPAAPSCFICGRSYGKGDGRFCSTNCRQGYDAGLSPCENHRLRCSLPLHGNGFLIDCAGCRKAFVSKGLRCCSAGCERELRERQEIAATMAEVGMESTGYVKRKCQQCGGDIPRYTGIGQKRRETRKDARFCSPKCSKRHGPLSKPIRPGLQPIEA